jgi:hypothetical protein
MAKFLKGQSGNPAGKPKGALDIRSKLALEFAAKNVDRINLLLNVMLDKGIEGDVPAAKLCCEYLLVKPKQEIDLTSNNETIKYPTLTAEQHEELARLKREKGPEE